MVTTEDLEFTLLLSISSACNLNYVKTAMSATLQYPGRRGFRCCQTRPGMSQAQRDHRIPCCLSAIDIPGIRGRCIANVGMCWVVTVVAMAMAIVKVEGVGAHQSRQSWLGPAWKPRRTYLPPLCGTDRCRCRYRHRPQSP